MFSVKAGPTSEPLQIAGCGPVLGASQCACPQSFMKEDGTKLPFPFSQREKGKYLFGDVLQAAKYILRIEVFVSGE